MRHDLINRNGYDCLDLALEYIFQKEDIPYFWMFSESWGFRVDLSQDVVGSIIRSERTDRYSLLCELYHVNCTTCSAEAIPQKGIAWWITDQSSKKKYIIAEVDSYELAWDRLYKTMHGSHMINLDCDNKGALYIYDAWYQKRTVISEESLLAITKRFVVVDTAQINLAITNEEEAVRRCLQHYNANRITAVDIVASRFRNIDMKKEFFGCSKHDYTKTPIMRNHKELVYMQKQSATYFRGLYSVFGSSKLLDIAKAFEINAAQIENIRSKIARAYLDGSESENNAVQVEDNYRDFYETQNLLYEEIKGHYERDRMGTIRAVKCVAWDLDNTIWDGTIDSGLPLCLKDGIVDILDELYLRGIPCIIVSKNDPEVAKTVIEHFRLGKYFLQYHISWESKWQGILRTAEAMNISTDSILFIDDSDIELFECKTYIPDIQLFPAEQYHNLVEYINQDIPITREARNRVKIYQAIIRRSEAEKTMSRQDFLDLCRVRINVRNAQLVDLPRVYELVHRTNQFNLSCRIYSMEQLEQIPLEQIYVADMDDRFGSYGTVSAMIVSETTHEIHIDFFAVSCKVEGRNIGKTMIDSAISLAKDKGKKRIAAAFYDNQRNKKLTGLFMLMGFCYCESSSTYTLEIDENQNTIELQQNGEYLTHVIQSLNEMGIPNVTGNMSMAELVDSMGLLELTMLVEQRASIKINLQEIKIDDLRTVSAFASSLLRFGRKSKQ